MEIVRAEVTGMCFGVRDALVELAAIADPSEVAIHGELVHNPIVLNGLTERGFEITPERRERAISSRPAVLITAHGASDRERARLEALGKRLIDTTCPLVANAHRAAKSLRDRGYYVLVIGKPGHVEVNGIVEDLPAHAVIERIEDVKRYDRPRLGVVCQTTVRSDKAERIVGEIRKRNPDAEVAFIDTICKPTKDHQRSLLELFDRVDAMVIVGGLNSNNTRELAQRSRERGLPTVHVESAGELEPDWFSGFDAVGLAAGTSTLAATLDEVHDRLLAIAARARPEVRCAAAAI